MTADTEALLDELVRRHARGEPLDVEDLLRRAGAGADELAVLIDRFLERAPRQEASAATLAYVRSLDDPPLLRARLQRSLRIDDVVDAIVNACELPAEKRGKVRRYYQLLEGGRLDPRGVSKRVWDGLAAIFGGSVEELAQMKVAPAAGAPAMYRRASDTLLDADTVAVAPPVGDEPADEVDALFLGRAN